VAGDRAGLTGATNTTGSSVTTVERAADVGELPGCACRARELG
jgi:hypothetical protein